MKKLSPRNAATSNMESLNSDNHTMKGFWILVNSGKVILAAQKSGQAYTAKIEIPRRQFHALIDWYNREQIVKERKP